MNNDDYNGESVCKGSFLIGNNCGHCAKCKREQETLASASPIAPVNLAAKYDLLKKECAKITEELEASKKALEEVCFDLGLDLDGLHFLAAGGDGAIQSSTAHSIFNALTNIGAFFEELFGPEEEEDPDPLDDLLEALEDVKEIAEVFAEEESLPSAKFSIANRMQVAALEGIVLIMKNDEE